MSENLVNLEGNLNGRLEITKTMKSRLEDVLAEIGDVNSLVIGVSLVNGSYRHNCIGSVKDSFMLANLILRRAEDDLFRMDEGEIE